MDVAKDLISQRDEIDKKLEEHFAVLRAVSFFIYQISLLRKPRYKPSILKYKMEILRSSYDKLLKFHI